MSRYQLLSCLEQSVSNSIWLQRYRWPRMFDAFFSRRHTNFWTTQIQSASWRCSHYSPLWTTLWTPYHSHGTGGSLDNLNLLFGRTNINTGISFERTQIFPSPDSTVRSPSISYNYKLKQTGIFVKAIGDPIEKVILWSWCDYQGRRR